MFLYQQPRTTVVRRRSQSNTNSARTDEVFEHILANALPPNPKALERIKELVKERSVPFAQPRREIARQLIADPGLALYYLRNLRSVLDIDTLPEDPLLPLQSMSMSQLRDFFDVPLSQISKHRIQDAGPPQLLRMQHTYIASKGATNLSRQFSVDEGKTFSLVNVSQAALNLLAWSYPTQFHKAIFNKKRFKASIEESLNSLIGVKPENLVNKMARKVGLPTSLLLDIQMSQRPGTLDLSAVPQAPSVLTLSKLGDLLAKANDREHYPEALSQWERVEKQLEERGLENPAQEIHSEIKEFIAELGGEHGLPYHMALFQTQAPKASDTSDTIANPNLLNPYFKKIPEKLRTILESVYRNINKGTLNVKALKIMLEEAVPEIGVHSGCLYLAKGPQLLLEPTLHFGQIKKNRPRLDQHSSNPISQSLFSNHPQRFDTATGEISICGSLPDCQKQAVLVMDFDYSRHRDLEDISFAIFQAFAVSLVDAIGQRIVP